MGSSNLCMYFIIYLHAPTVTALQTFVGGMLDLMALYTTQRKQYVCWSDQSNHRVGTGNLERLGQKWKAQKQKSLVQARCQN